MEKTSDHAGNVDKKTIIVEELKIGSGPCMVAFGLPLLVPGITLTVVGFTAGTDDVFRRFGPPHVVGLIILIIALILIALGIILQIVWRKKVSPEVERVLMMTDGPQGHNERIFISNELDRSVSSSRGQPMVGHKTEIGHEPKSPHRFQEPQPLPPVPTDGTITRTNYLSSTKTDSTYPGISPNDETHSVKKKKKKKRKKHKKDISTSDPQYTSDDLRIIQRGTTPVRASTDVSVDDGTLASDEVLRMYKTSMASCPSSDDSDNDRVSKSRGASVPVRLPSQEGDFHHREKAVSTRSRGFVMDNENPRLPVDSHLPRLPPIDDTGPRLGVNYIDDRNISKRDQHRRYSSNSEMSDSEEDRYYTTNL